MSSMEMPDAEALETYWSKIDRISRLEGAFYLKLFRPTLEAARREHVRRDRFRNMGVRRTATSFPTEVMWADDKGEEIWSAVLQEEIYDMPASPGGPALCTVKQKMIVKGGDDSDSEKSIVRPTLYVTEYEGGQPTITLHDPTELLAQPDVYARSQTAWFDRLRALAVAQDVVRVPNHRPPMSEAA